MNRIEKARPADGAAERATEMAAFGGAAISDEYFSTAATGGQGGKLWHILPAGEKMAVCADDLARLAEYGSTRALRAAVDGMRAKGFPILASENGYFRPSPGPAGIAEIRNFLRRQDSRAASNRKTTRLIRAQLRALEAAPLPGQTDLWQGGDT